MKYKIFRTNSFKRDFKKLENKYKDHNLKSNWNGCRESHLKPNLLLIYKINNNILALALLKIGNHSSIFKQ